MKRYSKGSNIGRETIQTFVGSLHGGSTTKGVPIAIRVFTGMPWLSIRYPYSHDSGRRQAACLIHDQVSARSP
ncbi:hypothetical protein ACWICO_09670 [Glutamicibacter sp. NPDC055491]